MESPFTHLLATNYVPSKHEIEEINDLLIDPINQLNHLDTKITRLQNLIETLTTQRNQLHDSIVGHKKLITPMRRIPQEILQEIFIRCLPTDHNAIMSSREAPLLLGRVCTLWRSVAMSTPRLWSSIHIAVLEDPLWYLELPEDGNTYVEAVKMWLGRSGTLPLSITLFHPLIYDVEHEKLLLSTLVSFSSRWRNVTILASSASFSIIAALSKEAAPLLNIFSFYNIQNIAPRFKVMPCDIYRAPHLREISSSHSAMIPPDINWSQLTALSIGNQSNGLEGLTTPIALDILRKCTNLTSCRMEFGPDTDHSPDDYHATVILPTLETLAVTEGYAALVSFFKHLDLPALVNLEFSPTPEIGSHLSISALLSRVDKLESLTISSCNVTRNALLECIKEAPPSIRKLSMLHYNGPNIQGWRTPRNTSRAFDKEVLGLLTPTGVAKPIFPCLKILECNPCGVSDEALLTFIQARTKHASAYGIKRLERVDINFNRAKEMDIASMFGSEICDVDIILTYHKPHIQRRQHAPWAGLKQPGRLEMTTKPFNN